MAQKKRAGGSPILGSLPPFFFAGLPGFVRAVPGGAPAGRHLQHAPPGFFLADLQEHERGGDGLHNAPLPNPPLRDAGARVELPAALPRLPHGLFRRRGRPGRCACSRRPPWSPARFPRAHRRAPRRTRTGPAPPPARAGRKAHSRSRPGDTGGPAAPRSPRGNPGTRRWTPRRGAVPPPARGFARSAAGRSRGSRSVREPRIPSG